MFLIRPKPFPLESLSSWRQRAGVANGFRRYPRPNGLSSWTEPDRYPSLMEANWIEEEYRLSPADVHGLCLESIGTNISLEFGRTTKLRWVIPCVNRKVGKLGGRCCPLCLAQDQVPHFRLFWRFAFITHCPTHGCPLIERCSICSALLWPTNARDISTKRPFDFRGCNNCGNPLDGSLDNLEPSISLSRVLLECATTNHVPARLNQANNSVEVFSALWVIGQLLLRNSATSLCQCLPDYPSELDECCLDFSSSASSIELLPNLARHVVIQKAYWLLSDWPDRFIYMCKKAHLSRHVFAPNWHSQPEWLCSIISENLSQRTTGITKGQVHVAIDTLRNAGKPVSKKSVRQTLGVAESLAVNEVLFQRRTGSVSELKKLCGLFERRLLTISESRDQKATLIRDYFIFLISVLSNKKIEQVCQLDIESVNRFLFNETEYVGGEAKVHKLLRNRAQQLNTLYLDGYRLTTVDSAGSKENMYLGRNGETIAGHTVRERISWMMKSGFPANLWKSADVFLVKPKR